MTKENLTLAVLAARFEEQAKRIDMLEAVVNELPNNELFLNNLAGVIQQRVAGNQQQQEGLPSTFFKLSLEPLLAKTMRISKVPENDETSDARVIEIRDVEGRWVPVDLEGIDQQYIDGIVDYAKANLPADAKEHFVTVFGNESPWPAYTEDFSFHSEDTGIRVKLHSADELVNPNGATLVMLVDGKWQRIALGEQGLEQLRNAFNAPREDADKLELDRYYNVVIFEIFARFEDFLGSLRNEAGALRAKEYAEACEANKQKWFAFAAGEVPATIQVNIVDGENGKMYNFMDVETGTSLSLTPPDVAFVRNLMGIVVAGNAEATAVWIAADIKPVYAAVETAEPVTIDGEAEEVKQEA